MTDAHTQISQLTIEPFIRDFSNVPTASDIDKVGAVINDLESSHDAVFIFDEKNRLQGLVSPQDVLYQHRYPPSTKTKHALIEPMHLTPSTSLQAVAEFMSGSRLYTLPVFDTERLIGIVTADSILQGIAESADLLRELSQVISVRVPITAQLDSTCAEVYALFKVHNVSRIVMVQANGALAGIVTRSDLFPVFVMPNQQRTRTSTHMNSQSSHRMRKQTFDDERITKLQEPARIYMNEHVQTAPITLPMVQLLKQLLSSDIKSIVLTRQNRPYGFISRYDVVKALSAFRSPNSVPIIFHSPAKNVREQLFQSVGVLLLQLSVEKLHKRRAVRTAEARFKKIKNRDGKTSKYECQVQTQLQSGPIIIGHANEYRVDEAVRVALRRVEKQFRRNSY